MGWQPIETAPKDAMSVLLFIPSKGKFGVKAGFWAATYDCWAWYGDCSVREARHHQPTHWMPLPDPPA